jgi:serine/threonine protein phosphatase PrpC
VYESKQAFLKGDEAKGLELFHSIKPDWQNQILKCLYRVGGQPEVLEWSRNAMLGQNGISVSSEWKAQALTEFLKEYVQGKLNQENQDARKFVSQHNSLLDPTVFRNPYNLLRVRHKEEFEKAHKYDDRLLELNGSVPMPSGVTRREVGIFAIKGRRESMEDKSISTQFSLQLSSEPGGVPVELYAVLDGHGGKKASKYLSNRLKDYLMGSLEKMNPEVLTEEGIFLAIKDAFLRLDDDFEPVLSGSTAIVAILLKDHLWVANLGDSRTVLSQNGETIQLTEDQKIPENYGELTEEQKKTDKYIKKVLARGGTIDMYLSNKMQAPKIFAGQHPDVNHLSMLAIPRSLGDHYVVAHGSSDPLKKLEFNTQCVIVHTPKITQFPLRELTEETILILACDGVWDVCTSEEAVEFVHENKEKNALELARELVYEAYNAGSRDNLSALVVRFKQ